MECNIFPNNFRILHPKKIQKLISIYMYNLRFEAIQIACGAAEKCEPLCSFELGCTHTFVPLNVLCYKRSFQRPADWLLKPSIRSITGVYPPSRNPLAPLPTTWRVVSNFPKLRAPRYRCDAYRRRNSFSAFPFRLDTSISVLLYYRLQKNWIEPSKMWND